MISVSKPERSEYPDYYANYYSTIDFDDANAWYKNSLQQFTAMLSALDEQQWSFRYGEGKWSIKQVVNHVTDAERIMTYRALCFARGETQELPGFEENDYAEMSDADQRAPSDLLNEIKLVRASTIALFDTFNEEQLLRKGVANGNPASVRAIIWVIPAHMMHHVRIIKERYLSALKPA
jgi:uncharacterized damage-inducible protein DinB